LANFLEPKATNKYIFLPYKLNRKVKVKSSQLWEHQLAQVKSQHFYQYRIDCSLEQQSVKLSCKQRQDQPVIYIMNITMSNSYHRLYTDD
jgi:hypothetical protein